MKRRTFNTANLPVCLIDFNYTRDTNTAKFDSYLRHFGESVIFVFRQTKSKFAHGEWRSLSANPAWTNDYPWLENGDNSMRCKACRNNGDIADNSSSYVKESGCTNYTLKSVKGHADSKQHRKVEDRIRNKATPLYRIASSDATVNKPEDA